jgi:hypothetical protein
MNYFTIKNEHRAMVELLTDEQAGRLLKALFAFATDGSELALDQSTSVAFVAMRAYIEQNAQRYAEICEKRAAAGRLHTGNQYTRVEHNGTIGTSVPTLEHNGTIGTKAKAKAKAKAKSITKEKEKRETTPIAAANAATLTTKEVRAKKFYDSLVDYVGKYGAQMVREFYDYWTESNAGGARMRFEMEKVFDVGRRLATWANRQKQFNIKKNGNYQTATERSRAEYLDALGRILAK